MKRLCLQRCRTWRPMHGPQRQAPGGRAQAGSLGAGAGALAPSVGISGSASSITRTVPQKLTSMVCWRRARGRGRAQRAATVSRSQRERSRPALPGAAHEGAAPAWPAGCCT